MCRKIVTCLLVIVFLGILSAWLYADANYEYPIYEYRETGRFLEYLDRLGGWEVEAIPIYEPDNPAWVGTIRHIAPFMLFVVGLAILYMFTPAIEAKITKTKKSPGD